MAEQLALGLRLGEDLYAIPIDCIREVLPALPIEHVPQCPDFIRGIIFVRGELIPVISAAERLGIRGYQRPLEPHILCLGLGGRLVGVEFDEAIDLIHLGDERVLAAAEFGVRDGFFVSVIELDGQIIRLLAPDKLVDSYELSELGQLVHALPAGSAS